VRAIVAKFLPREQSQDLLVAFRKWKVAKSVPVYQLRLDLVGWPADAKHSSSCAEVRSFSPW